MDRVNAAPNDAAALQVGDSASTAEVRRAYRRLCMLVHPDKCTANGAKEAFQKLTAAYSNLIKEAPR